MNERFYTPSHPGSFMEPTENDAKDWTMSQDAYTLHRRRSKKFSRRKTIAMSVDHLWQLDLADVTAISRDNDGTTFLLCCIDVLSRFAFVRPLRNKGAITVRDAFQLIVENDAPQRGHRCPVYVQSDKGREFVNHVFQDYLRSRGILFYTSENDDVKCAIVERFIRTLKSKMWRMFTQRKSYRYVDVLDDLVSSYNATYHSTIKTTPQTVDTQMSSLIFDRLYRKKKNQKKDIIRYKIGDVVRLASAKNVFEKGYYQKWTKELFTIDSVYETDPVTYGVKDYSGESIKGQFYSQELQKVSGKDVSVFEVEKVLKTRTRQGRKQYLVRWVGFSPKYDSWVDEIIE